MGGAGGGFSAGDGGFSAGGGSGGFGCSNVTSTGVSEGGSEGWFTDIHHNTATTRACSRTASANAEGDMRAEREEKVLTSWATAPYFRAWFTLPPV